MPCNIEIRIYSKSKPAKFTASTNMPRTIGRAERMGIMNAAAIYYGWIIGST
jgi:hypothetical protein